jgi:hypothetical protein
MVFIILNVSEDSFCICIRDVLYWLVIIIRIFFFVNICVSSYYSLGMLYHENPLLQHATTFDRTKQKLLYMSSVGKESVRS